MLDLCTECTKRKLCSSLCPEAEMYASQDWVYLQELPIGAPIRGNEMPELVEKSIFTKQEYKIVALLLEGKSRKEIAQLLEINRKALREAIRRIRKKRHKIS